MNTKMKERLLSSCGDVAADLHVTRLQPLGERVGNGYLLSSWTVQRLALSESTVKTALSLPARHTTGRDTS